MSPMINERDVPLVAQALDQYAATLAELRNRVIGRAGPQDDGDVAGNGEVHRVTIGRHAFEFAVNALGGDPVAGPVLETAKVSPTRVTLEAEPPALAHIAEALRSAEVPTPLEQRRLTEAAKRLS